jgi:hypothetical protein
MVYNVGQEVFYAESFKKEQSSSEKFHFEDFRKTYVRPISGYDLLRQPEEEADLLQHFNDRHSSFYYHLHQYGRYVFFLPLLSGSC